MAERKRIIYVHKGASSFVVKDQRILEAVFDVRVIAFLPKSKWSVPFLLAGMFVSLLREVPRASAVVCQFAGHHALLPIMIARLFGKRSIVISNGSDCVGFPSLNYGHFRKRLLAWSTRTCFRLCDRIVPLDASLVHHVPTYHDIDPPAQGILHFCSGLKTPITVLGYGFDPEQWQAKGERMPRRFITVASGAHQPSVQALKGLDMILQVAPRFPDAEFLIIGAREGSFAVKPANLNEVPFVPHDQITTWYGSATYYLQLSVSEGFGNALCEAMLCGCTPIVSNTGAMPMIVGGTGYVVQHRDVDVLERTIREALSQAAPRGADAMRQRIIHNYPLALRATGLPNIVREVIGRP